MCETLLNIKNLKNNYDFIEDQIEYNSPKMLSIQSTKAFFNDKNFNIHKSDNKCKKLKSIFNSNKNMSKYKNRYDQNYDSSEYHDILSTDKKSNIISSSKSKT